MAPLNRLLFQAFCFFIICAPNFLYGQTQLANLDSFNSTLYDKFGNGNGINRVYKVLELANGQILIGGTFYEVNGFPITGIARLNADGSFDPTFHSGMSEEHEVRALAELPSGKILVGGSFNSYDGVNYKNFVVLNPNGTRDATYTGTGNTGGNSSINDIQLAPGNKVIIAGYFTSFNGVLRNGLARLNSSFQVDASFGTTYSGNSGGDFESVLVFPDGGILVAGDFINYWGNGASGLIKLTAAGITDPNFNLYTPAGFNARVNKVKFTADGKILMCGRFNSYGGHTTECIVRLNANGSVDNSFQNSILMYGDSFIDCIDFNGNVIVIGAMNAYLNTNGTLLSGVPEILADNEITMIDKISDGSFIIGGIFSRIMNKRSGGIVKFSDINVIDNHFFVPPASHDAFGLYGNGRVENIMKYSNSKYLISGGFTEYNGDTINGLVRVDYNGEVDLTFNAHFPAEVVINTFMIQPDGKIVVNYQNSDQDYTPKLVRLEANGDLDNTFQCSLHYPISKIIYTLNNKILIAGERDYNSNGVLPVNRLNLDGSIDPAFTPYSPGDDVYSIIELSDGKILVAKVWGGVTKIKANGVSDPAFNYNSFSFPTTVTGFAVQSDGKIVFSAPGGNKIYRLNANGTTDATYQSEYNVAANYQEPWAIELQPDDKLLVYGNQEVFRFNTDGSLDNSFKKLKVTGGHVFDFLLDSNRLLVAGNYSAVNGLPINDIMGIDYSNNNTVGLKELVNPAADNSLHIYPNPLGFGQELNWEQNERIESLTVYSMDGRLLEEFNDLSGKKAINLNTAAGTYIIHTNDGSGKQKIGKLIVRF